MVGPRRNPARGKTGLPKIAAQRDFWEEERQAQRAGRQAKRAVCHGALPATSRRSVASLRANSRGIAAPVRALATSPTKKRDTRQVSLFLVGMVGLEPMTSCMSSMRSNQLSYTPATACISYHFPSPLVNQIRGRFRFFCPFGEFCRRRPAAAGRRPSPARRPQRRQKRQKRQPRPAKAGRAGRFFYSGGRIRLNTMPLMRMIAMHTGAM